MQKRFLLIVLASCLLLGSVMPTMAESILVPPMGISQSVADGLYGSLAGEAAWAGAQDFTSATVSVAAASADAHVVNRLFGDGRWGSLAGESSWSGTQDFTSATLIAKAATADTHVVTRVFGDGRFGSLDNESSWSGTQDFTSATALLAKAASGDTHVVNRLFGDGRYARLGSINTFASANTFNGNVTLGSIGAQTVTYKAGTHEYLNTTTFDFEAATTMDFTGQTMAMKGLILSLTGVSSVIVGNPTSGLGVLNSQTGDARYFPFDSIKSGTVDGTTFAGNPKTFTVTFGTAFADANYAVTIAAEDNRTFTFQTKLAGSFVMNANANLALIGDVDWTATAHNDP